MIITTFWSIFGWPVTKLNPCSFCRSTLSNVIYNITSQLALWTFAVYAFISRKISSYLPTTLSFAAAYSPYAEIFYQTVLSRYTSLTAFSPTADIRQASSSNVLTGNLAFALA